MKIFRILPVAAVACLMASCTNGTGGLSDNSAKTDSLMYYLGQINAGEYLREAERDTTMKEYSAKQAYLDGVKAGLKVLRDGDQNFNKGAMLGMQMAFNMVNFSEQMGVSIDKGAYSSSLSSALAADTMPNINMAQAEFRRLMTSIENEKKERDQVTSRESLKTVAEAAGLPKIDDDLYGKVTATTDGTILNKGDEVEVQATLTQENGTPISMPIAPKGKIGNKRAFPEIISNALLNLKSGETGEFMTTAHALTSGRTQPLNLKPEDVVKITITATLVPQEENKEEAK